ncbi:DinB family protein [Mucilaginibacter sp. L196]|uniref:DinB family protein n=1 Tax=Mucilaginibacter sp. L196 TaxID=1641870 RepID=UPI00131E6D88|nr:DinB family protein [Mucilaginibacter sp. L196]
MIREIEIIKQPRERILDEISHLSVEQLNKVPAGFNNNIIWNLGHMIAAQQGICYKRAGLDARVDDAFFNTYKPGTKPEGFVDAVGVEEIKKMLFTTLEQLEADYSNGIISNYTSFVTRYGIPLSSIDEALAFLPFHEGLHIGYIMSLKKLV